MLHTNSFTESADVEPIIVNRLFCLIQRSVTARDGHLLRHHQITSSSQLNQSQVDREGNEGVGIGEGGLGC